MGSIPACHAVDRGSFPYRRENDFDPRQAAYDLLSILWYLDTIPMRQRKLKCHAMRAVN